MVGWATRVLFTTGYVIATVHLSIRNIVSVKNERYCVSRQLFNANIRTSGYLDLVQRLEFGVDHLQKNAVYQIE